MKFNINLGIVKWIDSFLSWRLQRVVLDGTGSGLVPITSGVPQGSVLGPALFILYINDIMDVVFNSQIRLFADDTLLYRPVKNQNDVVLLQEDLNRLHIWSLENGMCFELQILLSAVTHLRATLLFSNQGQQL